MLHVCPVSVGSYGCMSGGLVFTTKLGGQLFSWVTLFFFQCYICWRRGDLRVEFNDVKQQ